MSRILRDHRRLVNETMRQAGKAGERVQQRRKREERLDHRERRQSLSASRQDQRLQKRAYNDARTDQWMARQDHKHDASWLRTMARGEADPRAVMPRTDAGAQAFQRVRPELTGGAPAAGGGAPGAPGGGGTGTPMGDRPSREEFLKQVAVNRETANRGLAPEKTADTGEKIDPAMQAYHAAERDFAEYDKRYPAQQAGAPPTAPEFHAAKGRPGEGVSIARGEDGVTYATDAVMPDTVVGSAIRNAFKDLSPEETQASIERMPEGHRGMAGRTAQGVQAGRAASEPYGGAGHPTPQGFSTPVPTKKGGEDGADAAGTTSEDKDAIDAMLEEPSDDAFVNPVISNFFKRIVGDQRTYRQQGTMMREIRQASAGLKERGISRSEIHAEADRVREENPDLSQLEATAEAMRSLGAEGISERPKEKGGKKGGEGSGSLDWPTGSGPEVEEQRARLRTRLMEKNDMGFGDWMARRNKLMKDEGLSLEEADAKLAKKLRREKL